MSDNHGPRKTRHLKNAYTPPAVLQYGRLDALTLGQGGNLPDFEGNVVVNGTCATGTFVEDGMTRTRVGCINAPAAGS